MLIDLLEVKLPIACLFVSFFNFNSIGANSEKLLKKIQDIALNK